MADWKHARPDPHVGDPTVFTQAAPSAPGPAFKQENTLTLSGQQVCAEEHSHGSWLQGGGVGGPALLLEHAARTRRRRAERCMGRSYHALYVRGIEPGDQCPRTKAK